MPQALSTVSATVAHSLLTSSSLAADLDSLFTTLNDDMVRLRQAAGSEDWDAVFQQAVHSLGFGYAAFCTIQSGAAQVGRQGATLDAAGRSLAAVFRAIARNEQREEYLTDFRAYLAANKPEKLAELEPSLQRLAEGKVSNVTLLEDLTRPRAVREDQLLTLVGDTAVGALSRGLLGQVHANFNRAYRAGLDPAGDLETALAVEIADLQAALRSRQLAIFQAAVADRPADDLAEAALALAGLVERRLPAFASTQARAILAAGALREQGKGGAARQLGRLAAQAGGITREALASQAAGYRLALGVLRSTPDDEIVALVGKATGLAFDAALPDGKNTELAKVAQAQDGAYLEIEGFVASLETAHSSDGKIVSRAQLVDASNGAAATIATVYTDLAHTGVTRGSFARVNGFFRTASVLDQERPAIEVDKLALADLAKASWRIAFLRAADPWYQAWRNGINMTWSLGPHQVAALAAADASEGAGELIYPPFVRV
jgi:hypothetical protein